MKYTITEEDISDLVEEMFAEAEAADDYWTSGTRLITDVMAKQLKELGFTVSDGRIVIDTPVSESEFNDAVKELEKYESSGGWYSTGDFYLRYSDGHVEVGCCLADWMFVIDVDNCWEKIAAVMAPLIENDSTEGLEDVEQFQREPVFHLVWANHMDDFTREAMKYCTLRPSFTETLEETRDAFYKY